MIGIIAVLTLRQLLGRGRTILIGLLALLPVLVALVYRLGSQDTNQQDWAATPSSTGSSCRRSSR